MSFARQVTSASVIKVSGISAHTHTAETKDCKRSLPSESSILSACTAVQSLGEYSLLYSLLSCQQCGTHRAQWHANSRLGLLSILLPFSFHHTPPSIASPSCEEDGAVRIHSAAASGLFTLTPAAADAAEVLDLLNQCCCRCCLPSRIDCPLT